MTTARAALRPVGGPTPDVVDALRGWLAADDPDPVVIETSGSTGAPKRVVLGRPAVLASVAATAARLGAQGRWLLTLPPSYVAGLQVVVRSLVAGHEPVLAGDHATFADATRALGDAPRFTSLVPTQLHRLLGPDADPADRAALLTYETVLLGGGPVDPELRGRAADAGVRLVATYGMSETAGGCVYDGVPLDGVRLAIGDDARVRIAGPVLFDGYEGDPALTAEVLHDGWFTTSDLGELRDGRLRILGRADDVLVTGGVKVPAPVVAARLAAHPAVTTAVVVGAPDAEWGQRLVAFVVGEVALDEARDWVAEVHPRSWAPREVRCVPGLPLTDRGKVDRATLEAWAAGPPGRGVGEAW